MSFENESTIVIASALHTTPPLSYLLEEVIKSSKAELSPW